MIINNDSLHALKELETDSIDAVITDPPYGYSFMGKDWDKAVPSVEIWKECLRVLKPGGWCMVMSAPRSDVQNAMISRLMEAGFRLDFTPIYWTYACLSEDTEVLTGRGWKRWEQLHKSDIIGVYDETSDTLQYESPTAWNTYRVSEDMYRIESEDCSQLVSRNHRVYTSSGLRFAEDLPKQAEVVCVPDMHKYIRDIPGRDTQETQNRRNVLHGELQTETGDQATTRQREAHTPNVRRTETATKRGHDWRTQSSMERRSNLLPQKGKLWQVQDKVRQMSERLFGHVSQGRLRYGASVAGGYASGATIVAHGSGTSYRPQPGKQQLGQPDAISDQRRSQEVRTRPKYTTSLATVSTEHYDGIIYCPTVSTGLFFARRNGKVFITGNSGFPKAGNVGKLVDKRLGNAYESTYKPNDLNKVYGNKLGGGITDTSFDPKSAEAKALDGSYAGFQPKPAVEVIIVAMKPLSEKTYIDQALKNGKGITWLDSCRIPTDENLQAVVAGVSKAWRESEGRSDINTEKRLMGSAPGQGRFPANLLVSDDVLNDGINHKSGSYSRYFDLDKWAAAHLSEQQMVTFPFAIFPKASKSEKNKGLEHFPDRASEAEHGNIGRAISVEKRREEQDGKNAATMKNHHPTVKPLKLMSYLITLTTREGDTVLDPFVGSGTTVVAANSLNRKGIGIEREPEYAEIARARVEAAEKVESEDDNQIQLI